MGTQNWTLWTLAAARGALRPQANERHRLGPARSGEVSVRHHAERKAAFLLLGSVALVVGRSSGALVGEEAVERALEKEPNWH